MDVKEAVAMFVGLFYAWHAREGNEILHIKPFKSVNTIRGHYGAPIQSASFRTGVKETMTRIEEDWYLSLGGETRQRYEIYHNFLFSPPTPQRP
jgi:hypothetical protein